METNIAEALRIWVWRSGDLIIDRAASALTNARAEVDRISTAIHAGHHGVGSFSIEIHAFDTFGIRLRRVEAFDQIRVPAKKTA